MKEKQKERRIVTWTPQEDDVLREEIGIHGTENWTIIAAKFKDKTTRQCRRRWYTYLNSDVKKGGWSVEEDMLLCEAQKVFGNRWTEIAKVVSGRTDNAVKNRFTTLCKKRAKENSSLHINPNSKRDISSDSSSPSLKKLRASEVGGVEETRQMRTPFATLAQNIDRINALRKVEEPFLKKDDPKMLALMQQAELLSSLASKVNMNSTEQSLDDACKVLESFLGKRKENDVLKHGALEADMQTSEREIDVYDSPSSSEYSNGSAILSTNGSGQMEQTQSNICTNQGSSGGAGAFINTSARILKPDVNLLVGAEEADNEEEISALLATDFSSPLQLTPLFGSASAAIPSPRFSESERHFLMKTLGIESPARARNTNPSQPPPCRRALVHSL